MRDLGPERSRISFVRVRGMQVFVALRGTLCDGRIGGCVGGEDTG